MGHISVAAFADAAMFLAGVKRGIPTGASTSTSTIGGKIHPANRRTR